MSLVWKNALRYYSWFICLYALGIYIESPYVDGWDYLDAFISFPSFVGILAYAHRYQILHRYFWRIYFVVEILWDIWMNYHRYTLNPEDFSPFLFAFGISIILPIYYAVFQMGYSKKIWPHR